MTKVYALSTCPWCKKLIRFLDQHNVEYEAIDVDLADKAEQEQALREVKELTGELNFPVTVARGETIQGYQPDRLKEVLGLED